MFWMEYRVPRLSREAFDDTLSDSNYETGLSLSVVSEVPGEIEARDPEGRDLLRIPLDSITVAGGLPSSGAWELCCSISAQAGGPPVAVSFDGMARAASDYSLCGYCGTGSMSRGMYVLSRIPDGKEATNCGECLESHAGLPASAADALVSLDAALRAVAVPARELAELSPGYALALASAAVREWGWVSIHWARERGGTATAARVRGMAAETPPRTPEEGDWEAVGRLLDLALSSSGFGEWGDSVREALARDWVPLPDTGIAVSGIALAEGVIECRAAAMVPESAPGPMPEGPGARVVGTVTGLVYRGLTDKPRWSMTVRSGEGWEVSGTVPAALLSAVGEPSRLRGKRVSFVADVRAADGVPGTGHASRPREAYLA